MKKARRTKKANNGKSNNGLGGKADETGIFKCNG
jgi:hypothetical protein